MQSHSENLADIAAAMCKAQAGFPNVEPDATGQVGQGKYRYATLSHILKVVGPTLAENGLSVIQTCEPGNGMRVTTTLLHASGQYISGTIDLPVSQQTPQAAGSSITYARRYSLTAILGIAPDEDDDGAQASQGGARTASRARTQPPAPAAPPAGPQARPAPSGQYGDMTPVDCSSMGRNWFFAKLRDLGYEHDTAAELLGITSFGKDMGDQRFSAIIGWVEAAKLKAEKAAANAN